MNWKQQRQSFWAETHSTNGLNFLTDAGNVPSVQFGRKHEYVPPNPEPLERVVARRGEHALVWRRMSKAYYAREPVRGLTYLGKYASDKEAKAVWRGRLRSMGII